jgi:hypothetical protein
MIIMKQTILSNQLLLTLVVLSGLSASISAQQVNSLYFLEQTPTHTQWNPAMAPAHSYIGLGMSSMSISVQSDLAFSDIFIPSATSDKLNFFLNEEVDPTTWLSSIPSVSNFNAKMDLSVFTLGLRAGNSFLSLNAGLHADFGIGIPKDLFSMMALGMDKNSTSTSFDLTALNVNAMMYSKIGVGLNRKIGNFTVGVNANYLQGIADLRVGFDKLTIDASENAWDVTSKGYIKLASPTDVSFKYNEDGYFDGLNSTPSEIVNQMKSMPNIGNGLSFDFGMTANLLDFLTLSAAVTDLGSIKWKKESVHIARSNSTYSWDGMQLSGDNNSDIMNNFSDMVHFEADNQTEAYSSKLTTKVNIGGEVAFLNKHLTLGLLSQTGIAENGNYQDYMAALNLKPNQFLQAAFTYSMLHGEESSFGTAINMKLLFINIFLAADYIPVKVNAQMIPINNSSFNLQTGLNFVF